MAVLAITLVRLECVDSATNGCRCPLVLCEFVEVRQDSENQRLCVGLRGHQFLERCNAEICEFNRIELSLSLGCL